jgi:hypothetical protein
MTSARRPGGRFARHVCAASERARYRDRSADRVQAVGHPLQPSATYDVGVESAAVVGYHEPD